MGSTFTRSRPSVRGGQRRSILQSRYFNRKSWTRYNNNNSETNTNLNPIREYKYFWNVGLFILLNIPQIAWSNTTVSSPQSTSQGVVNNNATMITPGMWPTSRYSQGIQCVSPSLTISPFISKTHSYALPFTDKTISPVYDEDTGAVKYHTELPRFEKDNYNLNFGGAIQLNIPLGRGVDLCHSAVKTNIKAQQLLITSTRLEIELKRLRICTEQAKLGAVFTGKYAVSCEGIKVTIPPGQVKPHVHSLSSSEK